MIFRSNVHTHTSLCDGKSSAQEVISEAISRNMVSIGFSGHSYTEFDKEYCMSREQTWEYKELIAGLRARYSKTIDILLGIEQDRYSSEPTDGYDYVIGSVHYIYTDGVYIPVDESKETLTEAVERYFDGDIYALVSKYYETVAENAEKNKFDIVGHFDLITKFNEGGALFDEASAAYRDAALNAMSRVIGRCRVFEINTGAMSRGYRTAPYPSPFLLNAVKSLGGEIIITSDSHEKSTLTYAFEEARRVAVECGFKHAKIITGKGFENVLL